MHCEVQSGYSERVCPFIYQRLLAPVWRQPDNVRQVHPPLVAVVASYHALELLLASRYCVQEQVLKYIPVQHHRLT